jgi:hypothetical protein
MMIKVTICLTLQMKNWMQHQRLETIMLTVYTDVTLLRGDDMALRESFNKNVMLVETLLDEPTSTQLWT